MKQDQDLRTIIASHEAELTDMERDIAQYFLSSEARQHSLSSSRVTELLHVSKAALTRFSQKCGFSGYREFVYHFNEETKNQKQVQEHDELTLSVLQRYHHISNVTESLVKDSQLDQVAELIDQADRVYFFGIGSSGLVAREMKLRFMRLGVVCEALTDQDGFAWTTSILDSSCLVIGFSLSGSTNSITDSLLDAKEKGALTGTLARGAGKRQTASFVFPLCGRSSPGRYGLRGRNRDTAPLHLGDAWRYGELAGVRTGAGARPRGVSPIGGPRPP